MGNKETNKQPGLPGMPKPKPQEGQNLGVDGKKNKWEWPKGKETAKTK